MTSDNISLYKKAIGNPINELAEIILQVARLKSSSSTIIYRIKNSDILVKKMMLKEVASVFKIEDVYGFRIMVSDIGEAYAVLGEVMKIFQGYLDHDYISTPKTRGDKPHLKGKSLKLLQTIAYRNNVPFEVQITTYEFNKNN